MELTIVSSGIGFARQGKVVRRHGSRPGDRICITGPLGRAQAGLLGYAQYRQSLLEPSPRVREGFALAEAGVTSMMDISDGLVLSLYDMLDANACGYSVRTSLLPPLHQMEPAGLFLWIATKNEAEELAIIKRQEQWR